MYQSSYWGQDLDKRLVDNHIIGVESASLDREVDTLHVDDLDSKQIISILYSFDHTGIFVVLASWMMSQCRILLKLRFQNNIQNLQYSFPPVLEHKRSMHPKTEGKSYRDLDCVDPS